MQNIQNPIPNEEAPLVSFIIPYYNLPTAMLRECIDSILSLSLRSSEREIIIIDDGSDKSPIQELCDNSPIDEMIYIRQKNGGLSVARNTGIRMARGKFLQFIDADDLLLRVPYEHCLDIARYQPADLILFNHTGKSEDKLSDYHDEEPASGTDYMRHHNLHGTACGYLFKKSVLGDLRFTPDIYHEDEEFTPQLLIRAERVIATDAKAYLYRERPDSIITSTNVRHKLKRINDFKAVIVKLHTLADTLPSNDKMAMQRRVAQLTMDFIYKVIVETRNHHYLERQVNDLHKLGLFPLPDKDYSTKYTWFRRLTNSKAGLALLMKMLPLMSKER